MFILLVKLVLYRLGPNLLSGKKKMQKHVSKWKIMEQTHPLNHFYFAG